MSNDDPNGDHSSGDHSSGGHSSGDGRGDHPAGDSLQDASPQEYWRSRPVAQPQTDDYARIISIVNETKRTGRWRVPAHLEVSIALGEVRLDLREAQLSAPVTTISVHGVMGQARIIVPQRYSVDCTGVGIVGSYDLREERGLPAADPDAALIRFTGGVFLGEVIIVRTGDAVGEGSFKVDGMAGVKHRRRARRDGERAGGIADR